MALSLSVFKAIALVAAALSMLSTLTACSSAAPPKPGSSSADDFLELLGERYAIFEPGGGPLNPDFEALPDDPRILVQPGGERLAFEIAPLLDAAIATIEHHHRRPFLYPVRIHVFANPRSFARQSPSPEAAGATVDGKLLLSPRLAEVPEKVAGILTHELAHLHFTQYLGPQRAYEALPRWFAEGFAVLVSGAGADRISETEALSAIARGERLSLERSEPALFAAPPRAHGLAPHMFYRQSALFVRFLQRRYGDPAFNHLLDGLFAGKPFEQAFHHAFGKSVPAAWQEFLTAVRLKRVN